MAKGILKDNKPYGFNNGSSMGGSNANQEQYKKREHERE